MKFIKKTLLLILSTLFIFFFYDFKTFASTSSFVETPDVTLLQSKLNTASTISLKSNGEYHLNKGLVFPQDVKIYGNNSTIYIDDLSCFYDNERKTIDYYSFFSFNHAKNNTLNIQNLKIVWNVQRTVDHVNIYYLFKLKDFQGVMFKNVEIIINPYSYNSVHPITFTGTAQKISFLNCTINNYTRGYGGSCIWFQAYLPGGFPSVVVNDCNFYSEAPDEMISCWGPYSKNISFKNCNFVRSSFPCSNIDHTVYKDSSITLVSKTTDGAPTDPTVKNQSSSISYYKCNFEVIKNGSSSIKSFICSTSYYGAPVYTSFSSCKIKGTFGQTFVSGEGLLDAQTTYIEDNNTYQKNITISFYQCDLDLDVPTLINSRSTNCSFNQCNINTTGSLIDSLYVDNLISCSSYRFVNNTISTTGKNLINGYNTNIPYRIAIENNKIYTKHPAFSVQSNISTDISKYVVRHNLHAKHACSLKNNIFY